jgi:C-terminal processing protease CtpA/Prc
MTRSRAFLLVSALYGLGLATGSWLAGRAVQRLRQPYDAAQTLLTVLRVVERDYVEPRSPDQLAEAAIEGVVGSLDEHSHWLEEAEKIQFEMEVEGRTFRSPLALQATAKGPVIEQAPVEPLIGARLLEVDGVAVTDRPLPEVEALLSRPHRQPPTLRVLDRLGQEQLIALPGLLEPRVVADW